MSIRMDDRTDGQREDDGTHVTGRTESGEGTSFLYLLLCPYAKIKLRWKQMGVEDEM
jgi:hypothetical protein